MVATQQEDAGNLGGTAVTVEETWGGSRQPGNRKLVRFSSL